MTLSQKKRVAIAKDVLNHIKSFYVTKGAFLCGALSDDAKPHDQFQAHVNNISGCQVCAIGACIIAKARLFDDLTLGRLGYGYYGSNTISVDSCKAYGLLGAFFEEHQLGMIEYAFETGQNGHVDDSKIRERAFKFGEKYKTDRGRLKGIMQNIIKNNGEFVP